MGFVLSERSRKNLEHVHPDAVWVARRGLDISPVDYTIIEGLRSDERHAMLLAAGKSWTPHSLHLMQDDGWAHAFDVMATGDLDGDGDVDADDVRRAWEAAHYELIKDALFAAAAERDIPLEWGGHWRKRDCPHFQLGPRYRR